MTHYFSESQIKKQVDKANKLMREHKNIEVVGILRCAIQFAEDKTNPIEKRLRTIQEAILQGENDEC